MPGKNTATAYTNMISMEEVPFARQHTHKKGHYDVHSLANHAKYAVEHRREPRWPHTQEIMTPEELAHISTRAAATGWSPGRHNAAAATQSTAAVPAALAGHAREAAAVRRELRARQVRAEPVDEINYALLRQGWGPGDIRLLGQMRTYVRQLTYDNPEDLEATRFYVRILGLRRRGHIIDALALLRGRERRGLFPDSVLRNMDNGGLNVRDPDFRDRL